MDIERFRQFVTVARLNHLGRAAEALERSQPALSQSMRGLEAHYGVRLFDRVGRSIHLNEAGSRLLEHVERVLTLIDAADREMRDIASKRVDKVALGYFGSRRAKAIPLLIREFQALNGLVDFGVFRGPDALLFQRLKDHTLDLCFTSRSSDDSLVRSEPLWHERLFLYVCRGHRLAKRRTIDLHEVSDEPMVTLPRGSDFRFVTDAICTEAGFAPRVVFEGQNIVTLHGLVAANVGVALAPELDGSEEDGVVAVTVRSPNCRRPIVVSWSAEQAPASTARRFRELVLQNRATMASIGLSPFDIESGPLHAAPL